jgi:hypothetical protein
MVQTTFDHAAFWYQRNGVDAFGNNAAYTEPT